MEAVTTANKKDVPRRYLAYMAVIDYSFLMNIQRFVCSLTFVILTTAGFGQTSQPEINVVYGDHHIFTINTPEDWINDKELAQQIGLTNFFYAEKDKNKQPKSYLYAQGYDKSDGQTLENFVKTDLKKFSNKYPEFKYDSIKTGSTGAIKNSLMMRFENLNDRFKEEVLYMETDDSIIILSFAAFTKQEYLDYQSKFDELINSFVFRGNNTKLFLDWMKSKGSENRK